MLHVLAHTSLVGIKTSVETRDPIHGIEMPGPWRHHHQNCCQKVVDYDHSHAHTVIFPSSFIDPRPLAR